MPKRKTPKRVDYGTVFSGRLNGKIREKANRIIKAKALRSNSELLRYLVTAYTEAA